MFDEEPKGDIHGECALEIHRLQEETARLQAENKKLLAVVKSAGWAKTSLEFCKGIDEEAEIARKSHLEDLADLLEDLEE